MIIFHAMQPESGAVEVVQVPFPPEDASPRQLLDFGAVLGIATIEDPDLCLRIIRAYLATWYPKNPKKAAAEGN